MRVVLLLMALLVHLVGGVSSAKAPKACRACRSTCGADVSACITASVTSCPSTPRGKARRCAKAAKRHCRKTVDRCCVEACKETGAPVCCGGPGTTTTTIPGGGGDGGGGGSPCFTDGGDGTVHDSCTGLQWEKKVGARGVHNADLHNLNNVYPWAGVCTRNAGQFCQPDAAAAATCAALADGVAPGTIPDGCGECPGGDYDPTSHPSGTGPCKPVSGTGPVTTVWVWLNQLNASNFAGHNDWRLPSQAARNSCPAGEPDCSTTETPRELETILRGVAGSCSSPCTYPIFGVPVSPQTWSSSTAKADPRYAWLVNFFEGRNERVSKSAANVSVRAVRTE